MSSKAEIKKAFFSQPHFAVVGASKDENKWGTKAGTLYPYHPYRLSSSSASVNNVPRVNPDVRVLFGRF
jgi:hypothetical protein